METLYWFHQFHETARIVVVPQWVAGTRLAGSPSESFHGNAVPRDLWHGAKGT